MNDRGKKIEKIAIAIVAILFIAIVIAVIVKPVSTITFLICLAIILWWTNPKGWGGYYAWWIGK